MFEQTIENLEKLHDRLGKGKVADDKDLYLTEIKRRLQQLDWILKKINQCLPCYHASIFALFKDFFINRGTTGKLDDASLELTTLTESFYLLAFRIVDILKKRKIPGIKFSEPKGIRGVRNDLITHPGNDALNLSFMVHPEKGPCLKNARIIARKKNKLGQVTEHDPCLFPNVEDLRKKLEEAFR